MRLFLETEARKRCLDSQNSAQSDTQIFVERERARQENGIMEAREGEGAL